MKENKSSISQASSYEEIGEFWDAHSLADYWDDTRSAEFEIDIRKTNRGRTEIAANIHDFFAEVQNGNIEIYNEFSFQHELGLYLRKRLPAHKVQFERNVGDFGLPKSQFIKREIDISVFPDDRSILACAFELKFPRNGQYPEQMYSFCKDVAFLEQLVKEGFEKSYFIAVVDDPLFYSGIRKTGIYAHFRSDRPIEGKIQKPTGGKGEQIIVNGSYLVNWMTIQNGWKYFVIEVNQSLVRSS